MRVTFKSLAATVFFFCFLLGQDFTATAEVKDLGEACFDMLPGMVFEGVGGQLRVGVLSFGAGHFILDGKIVPSFILEPNGRVLGSAFVDGNKVTMNLTSSNVTSLVDPRAGDNSFFQIELDAQTLSGRYVVLSYRFTFGQSPTIPLAVSPTLDVGTISLGQCKN